MVYKFLRKKYNLHIMLLLNFYLLILQLVSVFGLNHLQVFSYFYRLHLQTKKIPEDGLIQKPKLVVISTNKNLGATLYASCISFL